MPKERSCEKMRKLLIKRKLAGLAAQLAESERQREALAAELREERERIERDRAEREQQAARWAEGQPAT